MPHTVTVIQTCKGFIEFDTAEEAAAYVADPDGDQEVIWTHILSETYEVDPEPATADSLNSPPS